MTEKTILSVRGLSYTYPDGTKALQGVDLDVRQGEKVAFMGANGSGKSTFFLHLNGVYKPSAGSVYIDGVPINYSRKGLLQVRRKVGIVFQDPDSQLFSASVAQEISFGVLNLGASQEEAKNKVDAVIEELEIAPFREKPTHFLSGGQKKRVSIADIAVMEPDIIILDEPSSALDPYHAEMIDALIDRLSQRGITVLLSTHDVERAMCWADRVVLFCEGKIAAQGSPEEIFSQEELMELTHLKKPVIYQLFDSLKDAGMLPQGLPVPRTVQQLTHYIEHAKENKEQRSKTQQL